MTGTALGALLVGRAPGDVSIAGSLESGQSPIERKARIRQGHAGDLEPRRLAAIGRLLFPGPADRRRPRSRRQRSLPSPLAVRPARHGDSGLSEAVLPVKMHQRLRGMRTGRGFAANRPMVAAPPATQTNRVCPGTAICAAGGWASQSYRPGLRSSFEFSAISQVISWPV